MDNKLMVCDRQTSVKRYSGLYNGLLVPVSEERLLGQERLEHDIAYGTIIAKYRNGDTSISFRLHSSCQTSKINDMYIH